MYIMKHDYEWRRSVILGYFIRLIRFIEVFKLSRFEYYPESTAVHIYFVLVHNTVS